MLIYYFSVAKFVTTLLRDVMWANEEASLGYLLRLNHVLELPGSIPQKLGSEINIK